jgi:hypothetical protein
MIDHLEIAQNYLDRSEGDVYNKDHKTDLQITALINALIGIGNQLHEIKEAVKTLDNTLWEIKMKSGGKL